MVEQTVEEVVARTLSLKTPPQSRKLLLEVTINAGLHIAAHNEAEELPDFCAIEWQVTDFINNQQIRVCGLLKHPIQVSSGSRECIWKVETELGVQKVPAERER